MEITLSVLKKGEKVGKGEEMEGGKRDEGKSFWQNEPHHSTGVGVGVCES